MEEVLPDLKQEGVRVFYLNSTSPTPGVEALLPAIEAASDEPMPDHYRTRTTTNSKAIYIYTSGTTGEPMGGGSPPWRTASGCLLHGIREGLCAVGEGWRVGVPGCCGCGWFWGD